MGHRAKPPTSTKVVDALIRNVLRGIVKKMKKNNTVIRLKSEEMWKRENFTGTVDRSVSKWLDSWRGWTMGDSLKLCTGQRWMRMVMNGEEGLECEVHVDGVRLELVWEFKYLGCVLDKSGTDGGRMQ